MFEKHIITPPVLPVIRHVLGHEFKGSSWNSSAPIPGHGRRAMHADWSGAVQPANYFVCNSIWLHSDFTSKNSATRIFPKSHGCETISTQLRPNAVDDYPNHVQLIAQAGTVFVFNAHLWHVDTKNETNTPRQTLHSYFCCRDIRPQLDRRKWLEKNNCTTLPGNRAHTSCS